MSKTVFLKKHKEESLKRYHPWIFSGAILRKDPDIAEGDVVNVVSNDGTFLAKGHYQTGSIAVRILSFNDESIDSAFWERRIQLAYKMRLDIGIANNELTTIYRLVHGEGDLLPGLIIDIYGNTAVMQAHSIGMHLSRNAIANALTRITEGKIGNVYYKSSNTLPTNISTNETEGFLIGSTNENIASEYGLRFRIDWAHGQKTGFFVDQRENRHLLERYTRGRNVLNLFCYTGGFSVAALHGGAKSVVSVDSSAKAIDLTNENVVLNFKEETTNHKAVADDAFKFLDSTPVGQFDLIVLDPPAFAKHREAIHNALKGYIRLNEKALQKIKSGGIVFTFSCSQAINKDQFRQAVFTAAALAKRNVRILHQMHQPADHPINIYHPEGEYLKGLVLYVE